MFGYLILSTYNNDILPMEKKSSLRQIEVKLLNISK